MSFIRSAEGCLRRAHMERDLRLDHAGEDAMVGHLFHHGAAAVGFVCVTNGQSQTTAAEAREIAVAAINADRDGPLPKAAWDTALGLIVRWAPTARFEPGELFEQLLVTELDGRRLSARIDRLAVIDDTILVCDYKTGWADPAGELTMQGEMYAWHALNAHPDAQRVLYVENHIRAGVQSGPWEIHRDDLDRTEEWLGAAIARIDDAYQEASFPATPGSACSSPYRCPVAASCPIHVLARPATVIATRDDAISELEQLLVDEAVTAARKDRLRGWLDHSGERALAVGGEEIGRAVKPGNRFNRKRLANDLAASGAPLDLAAYDEPSAPSFGRRKAVLDEP